MESAPDPVGGVGREFARRVAAEVVSLLAGPAAERLLAGRCDPAGRTGDDEASGEFVFRASSSAAEADRRMRECAVRAAAIVREYRAAVERVAEALLASDSLRLSGRQVRQLVGEVRRPARA